jgi:hypothetical protein
MISSAGAEIRSVLFLSCDVVMAGDADGFLVVGSLTSGFVTSFKSHVPSVRALAANERSTLFAVSGGAHLSLWDSLRLTCIQVVPWPNVVLGTAFSSVLNCILVSIDSKGVAAISLDDYSERVLTVPLGNVLGFCAGMSGSSHACVSSMFVTMTFTIDEQSTPAPSDEVIMAATLAKLAAEAQSKAGRLADEAAAPMNDAEPLVIPPQKVTTTLAR